MTRCANPVTEPVEVTHCANPVPVIEPVEVTRCANPVPVIERGPNGRDEMTRPHHTIRPSIRRGKHFDSLRGH